MGGLSRRTLLGAAAGVALAGCTPAPTSTQSTPGRATATARETATPGATALRLATASDGHLGEKGTPSQRYLKELVAAVNEVHRELPIEVLVLNGDLTNTGGKQLQAAKDGLDRLRPSYLTVPGNHDHADPTAWRQLWGTPVNLVRRFGTRSVILANTSNQAGEFRCANSAWLREALAAEADQQDVLVFMHITPKEWTENGVDCPEIRELLADAPNVRAVFNGHDHDQAGIKRAAGIPYVFDSHYGGSWGADYRAFRLIEVSGTKLKTWLVTTAGRKLDTKTISW